MADKAIGVHLKDWHIIQGVRTGNSPWSPIAIAQVPVKEPAPSAPTVESVTAPEASAGVLEIKVSMPETNADGTALARAELVRLRLHHSTSPGVDESDPYVDFPPSETLLWAPNDTVTHYVRVRVQDSHGLWSELSNEASGQASASLPQEDSGLWAHRLGVESIFTNDSPDPGYVSWSNVVLYWKDNKYEIEDGSTNKKYIWWDHSVSTTTFQTSDTRPELDLEDVIVGYNDNGTWRLMCYQPTVMADYVRAGVLQSSNWGASTGSQFDLDDGTFKLGGSDSPKLSWDGLTLTVRGTIQAGSNLGGGNVVAIDSSGLDVGSSGQIKGGANGYDSGSGFWLGYDSGAYKFFVGNSSGNKLTWDGSALSVVGSITITSGSGIANLSDAGALATLDVVGTAYIEDLAVTTAKIADAAITNAKIANATITSAKISDLTFDKITAGTNTASLVIGPGGYIKSANYSAGSAGFKIDGSGDAEFNDVTVRGALVAESGSDIDWSYISNVSIGTADIENAAITTAKIADLAVTGAKIADATISSAKISSLTFDKITAGTNTASLVIGSGGYIKSSNYSAGSSGFIIYGSGNAEFNDVTVRGAIISGSGSSLNADYINAGTLTGRTVQTAASGMRIVLSAEAGVGTGQHTLAVYDSSGWRLKLGAGAITLRDTSFTSTVFLGAGTDCYIAERVSLATMQAPVTGYDIHIGGKLQLSNQTISTGKTAMDAYLKIYVDGAVRYLRLYA